MRNRKSPLRDVIVAYLRDKDFASVDDIVDAASKKLGTVPRSSVRSSLNLNTGGGLKIFERVDHGKYRLSKRSK
jgi:hypothetical protein